MTTALIRRVGIAPCSMELVARRISATAANSAAVASVRPTPAELRDRWRDPNFPKAKLQHFIEYDNQEKKVLDGIALMGIRIIVRIWLRQAVVAYSGRSTVINSLT